MKRTNDACLKTIAALAAMVPCTHALAATDLRDTDGDIALTLEGSPYRLVEDIEIDAYSDGECVVERETLTIEKGVELELGSSDIVIRGGILDVRGATLTSTGSDGGNVHVHDRRVCGRDAQGRATITGATFEDVDLRASDTASLTVSDTTFRDAGEPLFGLEGIVLLDESSGSFDSNSIGVDVTLNSGSFTFSGNAIERGRFDIGQVSERDRTLSRIDGVSVYRLVDDLGLASYASGACEIGQETLTIDNGVEVRMNGYDFRLRGGILDVRGATLTGVDRPASEVVVGDGRTCQRSVSSRVTFAWSSVVDTTLLLTGTSLLTISNSTFRDFAGSTANRITLSGEALAHISGSEVGNEVHIESEASGTLSRNLLRAGVRLNSPSYELNGNVIERGHFEISHLGTRDRTLGAVDGVSVYRLESNLTRDAYNSGSCEIAQETLTVANGVEVDLNGNVIRIRGGVLEVHGALLASPDSSFGSAIQVEDLDLCNETVQGRAVISRSTIADIGLRVQDTASLRVSDSVFQVSNERASYEVALVNDATATITSTDFRDTTGYAIRNGSSQEVTATGNFWGCSEGPNATACARYSGTVNDGDWVTSANHSAVVNVSMGLVAIEAFDGDDSLGDLVLTSPVEVPTDATQLKIEFRLADRAGTALSNKSFNIGQQNGLQGQTTEITELTTDDGGSLNVTVDISSSFGESAAHLWIGVYPDSVDSDASWSDWGKPLAQFVGHFATFTNMDVVPVAIVLPARSVLRVTELAAIRALGTAAYLDFGSDSLRDLVTVDAERRLAGVVSAALDRTIMPLNSPIAEPVPAAVRAALRLTDPADIEHMKADAAGGMVRTVALTPRHARKIPRVTSRGTEIWNGARCGLALDAKTMTTIGAGHLAVGGNEAIVCTGFAAGLSAITSRAVQRELRNCEIFSPAYYPANLFSSDAASIGFSAAADPDALEVEISLNLVEFARAGEDRDDCQWFAGQSSGTNFRVQ